jgi:hypothetical protein
LSHLLVSTIVQQDLHPALQHAHTVAHASVLPRCASRPAPGASLLS